MLTMGWSDGATFMPIDFSLLSSNKSCINGISEDVDKRSSGYKRRKEALQTAPEQIPGMISRAMNAGVDASYVLMDSWFTQQPLIKEITEQGLDVIGMVKKLKQRYLVDGKEGVWRSIHAVQTNGVPVKVVLPATATKNVNVSLS